MRAFHTILDSDNNRIGFANKKRGFGAEIVGEGAYGKARPWYRFGKEDEPMVIPVEPVTPVPVANDTSSNSTETNKTDLVPTDPDAGIIKDDVPLEHRVNPVVPDGNHEKSNGSHSKDLLIVTIALVILLIIMLILMYKILKKRQQRQAEESTFDDEIDPPLLHQEQQRSD